jgi:hypothetical protein
VRTARAVHSQLPKEQEWEPLDGILSRAVVAGLIGNSIQQLGNRHQCQSHPVQRGGVATAIAVESDPRDVVETTIRIWVATAATLSN